jgi:hypothetical protein
VYAFTLAAEAEIAIRLLMDEGKKMAIILVQGNFMKNFD